jgi:hypothetical protein
MSAERVLGGNAKQSEPERGHLRVAVRAGFSLVVGGIPDITSVNSGFNRPRSAALSLHRSICRVQNIIASVQIVSRVLWVQGPKYQVSAGLCSQ